MTYVMTYVIEMSRRLVRSFSAVGVLQVGGGLDLLHEPLAPSTAGSSGAEDLDGDVAGVFEVLGETDRGHAALTDLPLDLVAAGQGGSQVLE